MNADRVSLTFFCVDCGRALVMRVPKERGIYPGTYPWRCFRCQGRWPGAGIGRSGEGCEPTKQEEG